MSFNIDLTSLKPSSRVTRLISITISQLLSVLNTFNCIINKGKGPSLVLRDTYSRSTLVYNSNYNLYTILYKDIPGEYNPYIFKELLYNNRLIIIIQLFKYYILTPLLKRPRIL